MTDWYSYFLLCVLILWALSSPRDRNALRIVLIASLASEVIVDFITHQIHAPWKLVIPGLLETLTILALLKWARNRTGYLNVGCLCIAWLAHLLCYLDVWLKTNMVYSRYEGIIMVVAIGQLLACHDTIISTSERAYTWASGLWRVPSASRCAAVSSNPRREGV